MEFTILIAAPPDRVWETLWNDKSYREWTAEFSPGSWANTDWKKGSKTLFLGPDNTGMLSVIEDVVPNEFMSIRHLGVVKNGVEDTESEEAAEWVGAMENYRLKSEDAQTELQVFMSSDKLSKDMYDYFAATWPRALRRLKAIAES